MRAECRAQDSFPFGSAFCCMVHLLASLGSVLLVHQSTPTAASPTRSHFAFLSHSLWIGQRLNADSCGSRDSRFGVFSSKIHVNCRVADVSSFWRHISVVPECFVLAASFLWDCRIRHQAKAGNHLISFCLSFYSSFGGMACKAFRTIMAINIKVGACVFPSFALMP